MSIYYIPDSFLLEMSHPRSSFILPGYADSDTSTVATVCFPQQHEKLIKHLTTTKRKELNVILKASTSIGKKNIPGFKHFHINVPFVSS